jgi:hypothetical protein
LEGQCAPSRQACRHTLASAALPEAHTEVLCRRRQRYKYVSVVERPQQCSHKQLELVDGISPRGPTYLFTEKAGYINSAPLYICRVAHFLLRQRRGAGLVCDSVAALALASCNEHVDEANVSRSHPPTPRVPCTVPTQSSSSRGRRNSLTVSFGKHARTPPAFSLFPGQTATLSFLHFPSSAPFFSRVLPTSELLFRARSYTCRRASAVVRWAPSF